LRRVQVDERIVGKFAAKTIFGPTGHAPLLRRGVQIRAAMVDALRRRGVDGIWITDEMFPDLEVQEVVRQEAVDVTRRCLGDIFKAARASAEPTEGQALRLAAAVRTLVDEIVQNDDVVANVSHLRAWDNYTFEHSVQVAILSVLVGKHMMMTQDQLVRLGTGAILHDVGKVVVPQEILQKAARLTDEEFDIVRQHPRLGWDLVHDGFHNIMPTSSIVVLQHHERLDGSGYP
jgi:HD-GYP domain-containing protein (c-di-GMP phosphodiesterase class II)